MPCPLQADVRAGWVDSGPERHVAMGDALDAFRLGSPRMTLVRIT